MARRPAPQGRVPLGLVQRTFDGPVQRMNSRLIPKAHIHDPRVIDFVPPSKRYSDLIAQWNMKEAWERSGMVSQQEWHQIQRDQGDQRYPVQLQNNLFSVNLALVNEVKLLIPRNKYRFSWSIANFTDPGQVIYWSFGPPIEVESGLIAGFPLQPGAPPHMEAGNSIAIDAIYVFTRIANPVYVIASEGTIAPEANIL